jgi:Predicted dehydrogenases and related proteins
MADIKLKEIYTAALVGTGRIGFTLGFDKKREQPASHTKALNANPRISLIAGIDSNPENLSAWQKANPKARSFNCLKAMSAALKETPDIIVVAVNEDAHLSVTLEALSLNQNF